MPAVQPEETVLPSGGACPEPAGLLIVEDLSEPRPDCDIYLAARPDALLCHTYAWNKMVERTFGHKCHYLVATSGGAICGVLPLVHIRSRLFGNQLVSGAFGNYGGAVFNDPAARDALYQRSVELAGQLGCECLEFRNIDPWPYDLKLRTDKVCFRLPLPGDADVLWKSFKSETKVRNHVRKAEKGGITTECGGLELMDEFYDLYTIRMHQLGTPAYPRRLMENIVTTFPETSRVLVARLNGLAVAVRLAVSYNGVVESCWGVTRIEYNDISPNHALYWAALKHYCAAGAKYFDFGRSTVNTPPYFFKKQWGSPQIQLHYQYWSPRGQEFSILTPDNSKYRRKVELWKKLPLWLTRVAGPIVSRGIP